MPGLEILEATQGTFENSVQTIMLSSGILSLFLAGIFQYLIGFMSVLQIMVIPVLFTLNHPLNAKVIQVTILKMCALDFF